MVKYLLKPSDSWLQQQNMMSTTSRCVEVSKPIMANLMNILRDFCYECMDAWEDWLECRLTEPDFIRAFRPKIKIVVFRYPDLPYFIALSLKFFQTFGSNFTMIYYKNETLV